MPRKVRTPKAQIGALPAPAMMYTLMTGQGIPTRMHGWVALMQAGQYRGTHRGAGLGAGTGKR